MYNNTHKMFVSIRTPYLNELYHHGVQGQKWGVRHGPPYPLYAGHDKSKAVIESKKKYGPSVTANKSSGSSKSQKKKALEEYISTKKTGMKVFDTITSVWKPNTISASSSREYKRWEYFYASDQKLKKERDEKYQKLVESGKKAAFDLLNSGSTIEEAKNAYSNALSDAKKEYKKERLKDFVRIQLERELMDKIAPIHSRNRSNKK